MTEATNIHIFLCNKTYGLLTSTCSLIVIRDMLRESAEPSDSFRFTFGIFAGRVKKNFGIFIDDSLYLFLSVNEFTVDKYFERRHCGLF
jgi:hypothetical protein